MRSMRYTVMMSEYTISNDPYGGSPSNPPLQLKLYPHARKALSKEHMGDISEQIEDIYEQVLDGESDYVLYRISVKFNEICFYFGLENGADVCLAKVGELAMDRGLLIHVVFGDERYRILADSSLKTDDGYMTSVVERHEKSVERVINFKKAYHAEGTCLVEIRDKYVR